MNNMKKYKHGDKIKIADDLYYVTEEAKGFAGSLIKKEKLKLVTYLYVKKGEIFTYDKDEDLWYSENQEISLTTDLVEGGENLR